MRIRIYLLKNNKKKKENENKRKRKKEDAKGYAAAEQTFPPPTRISSIKVSFSLPCPSCSACKLMLTKLKCLIALTDNQRVTKEYLNNSRKFVSDHMHVSWINFDKTKVGT